VAFALNSDDEVEVVVISPPLTAISPLKVPPAELIPAKALTSPDSRIILYPVLPVEYPPTELNGISGIIQ
jgi:hypothetical protein